MPIVVHFDIVEQLSRVAAAAILVIHIGFVTTRPQAQQHPSHALQQGDHVELVYYISLM